MMKRYLNGIIKETQHGHYDCFSAATVQPSPQLFLLGRQVNYRTRLVWPTKWVFPVRTPILHDIHRLSIIIQLSLKTISILIIILDGWLTSVRIYGEKDEKWRNFANVPVYQGKLGIIINVRANVNDADQAGRPSSLKGTVPFSFTRKSGQSPRK